MKKTFSRSVRSVRSVGSSLLFVLFAFSAVNASAALSLENAGVTNISYTTANITATLISTNGTNPVITVFYGFSDGLTNPAGWTYSNVYGSAGTGLISVAVSNLTLASLYYYRFQAVETITNTTNSAWSSGSSNWITLAGLPI